MQPNTSLEPTGVGAVSSAARFTSLVAGGSVLGRQATTHAMQNMMRQAIEMSQQEAIDSAEAKLGRKLTDVERGGIQRIGSLMMLESVCRSFAAPTYSAAQIQADLEQFSK